MNMVKKDKTKREIRAARGAETPNGSWARKSPTEPGNWKGKIVTVRNLQVFSSSKLIFKLTGKSLVIVHSNHNNYSYNIITRTAVWEIYYICQISIFFIF